MTSIFEISGWSDVASFFIWTLAVCAIAKAVFGSLPAAEIRYRLALRDAPKRQRISQLNWEINHRARWSEGAAGCSPHAAKVPLTEAELDARGRELQRLTRKSLGLRVMTYFMGCFACQTFWTAVAVYALTRGVTDVAAWLLSAAAYSGAAVLVIVLNTVGTQAHGSPSPSGQVGCKGCGK